jgi:hypothetical protein
MFMKTSFLDYYKLILDKVSFDRQLLAKEYQKAKATLAPHELPQLNAWLRAKGMLPPQSEPWPHHPNGADTHRVWRNHKPQNA